ncbi:hypothetical protein PRN20_01265 [Devosia sp. ZB163]|uniref:hypothetical protein n=1 Tax=Devosia sp. ZB163 TaxID=3025938 RepID=UPI00235F2622|nr:hypothetical protein [Devosia sp. ZB163]MDC9822346.1 hypothetical protein [Devosia sp. ZB163]
MQTGSTLRFVEQGMKVFDREHHEIGKVEFVRFGDDDPDTPEVEASGLSDLRDRESSFIDDIARAFHPDDMPEEIRERLLHQGFVRIDANGLFAADRYITPEQIASVSDDGLTLNVTKDELIKRH